VRLAQDRLNAPALAFGGQTTVEKAARVELLHRLILAPLVF
jgi:hypothetical protein